jgi:hypothetical protein
MEVRVYQSMKFIGLHRRPECTGQLFQGQHTIWASSVAYAVYRPDCEEATAAAKPGKVYPRHFAGNRSKERHQQFSNTCRRLTVHSVDSVFIVIALLAQLLS